ncbi:DUF262 domain-containing protein [uncultured Brachyspira sp.]|uniref:DUF262 domain-containing protein n=1 Tax=uncultured Brachyspira sp. TaxID=221953 RepID=UPI002625A34B|nr:DUF262 domain-containing protein [uncultured Brachyspira sp.]
MSKLKSLIDIIENEFIILIPAMQRDYVQGRMCGDKEENVIKNFISYLKEALLNKKQCELDFIYGVKKDNKYIILDGQQRITTLFLLYWYLAQKSDKMEKFREKFTLKENDILKSKLQYEVRASSLDFCNAIVNKDLYSDFNNGENISNIIKNKNWFMYLWYYDPTIKAMLNTMDVIHSQFKDFKDIGCIFDDLIKNEDKLISFQFLDLEDKSMSLSDDIYIKMNSTGIPLTAFENFKAKLEQYLNGVQLQYKIVDKCFNLREYFSRKIDTDWSDFFLSYCKDDEKLFDEKVMNIFHNIFYNEYYEKIYSKDNKDNKEDYFNNKEEQVLYFEDYYCSKVINEESIKEITVFLDCLVKMKDFFDKYNKYGRYDISQNLGKILNNNVTFMDRINFAALYRYIIKYSDKILDDDNTIIYNFNEFMRVIVNYTENTDSTKDNYIRDIKVIDEFIKNSDNILEFIKNTDIKYFDVYQREEEKIKAYLITENEELWKNRIIEMEKNEFCKYQIKFLLDMSVKSVNDSREYDTELFDKYKNIAECIFDAKDDNKCINKDIEEERLFERALLTYKGKCYLLLEWENNFYNKSKGYWKGMLKKDDFIPIIKYIFDEIYKYYNGNNISLNDIKNSLLKIINNSNVEDWRELLINDYYNLNDFRRILNKNDKLYLITRSKMSSYHVEFLSYLLLLFFQNQNLNSNIKMDYIWQYSYEEPYVHISVDDKTIKIYGEQLSSENRYKMEVYKENNLICTKYFQRNIEDILNYIIFTHC